MIKVVIQRLIVRNLMLNKLRNTISDTVQPEILAWDAMKRVGVVEMEEKRIGHLLLQSFLCPERMEVAISVKIAHQRGHQQCVGFAIDLIFNKLDIFLFFVMLIMLEPVRLRLHMLLAVTAGQHDECEEQGYNGEKRDDQSGWRKVTRPLQESPDVTKQTLHF